jgi:phage terminase small subunit
MKGQINRQQARFVAEYLVDLDATAAAIRAGYSEKNASSLGYQLLQKSTVQAAVEAGRRKLMVTTEITQERVLSELARLAFSDVTHYDVDEHGNVKAAEGAPKGAMRAISSIKRKVFTDKDGNVSREVEIKLWDKPGPLRLAGKHVGLFQEKIEVTLPDLSKLPQEQLAALEAVGEALETVEAARN